jgi:DNA-binding CsgD family transcriptional regulator
MNLYYRLTDRERSIVKLLQEGYAYKDIACQLEITYGTLKTYVSRLLAKTHLTKTGLIKILVREELLAYTWEISQWVNLWGDKLPEESLLVIRDICRRMVESLKFQQQVQQPNRKDK